MTPKGYGDLHAFHILIVSDLGLFVIDRCFFS